MKMIINRISIISSESKEAKTQVFSKGINVVTSSGQQDGNFTGKSCILRSIFHTLGAEGKFNYTRWESEGKYIYILDFSIDENNYIMLRKNSLFKLYDKDILPDRKAQIFSVNNRDKLAEELVKLFNQEIYLKGHDGHYKLAHPVYNYLLNYIEQKEIKLTEFRSFNDLTAFPSGYYKDLIYSHLGIGNKYENDLKENLNRLNKRKKDLDDRNTVLNEINKEIVSKGSAALDLDVLKDKLQSHEEKYRKIANELNKHKKKLMKAHNTRVELEQLLKDLETFIDNEKTDIRKALKKHLCPHCDSIISDEQSYYFHRVKHIDGYGIQKLTIEESLAEINRTIELENEHYKKVLQEVKLVEEEIFNSSKEVKDGLKILGMKEIESNVVKQIGEVNVELSKISDDIKTILSEIRKIENQRTEVNQTYNYIFSDFLLNYRITGVDEKQTKKAVDKIESDATETNIAAVAWLCTLLKTKYTHNSDAIVYPLIFDTPNNADLDQKNKHEIFRLLFDNLPTDGQIITSLVGFDRNDYENYNINVIQLKNPSYDLLNKEDYIKCIEMVKDIIKLEE